MYVGLITGSTATTTGKAGLNAKLGVKATVPVLASTFPIVENRCTAASAGSLRRSYHPTKTLVPSGVTVSVGMNWSVTVLSSLTLAFGDQVAPPSVEREKYTSLRSPAALPRSFHTT